MPAPGSGHRSSAWIGAGLAALILIASPDLARAAAGSPPRSAVVSEGWLFQPDPTGAGDAGHWERPDHDRRGWRAVAVPLAWDFLDPVMDGYEGVGWYAVRLPAERVAAGAWQRIRFGRANHAATVWIDGREAGRNLTGYLPFEVAATPHLTPGRAAWIVVRVENGARYDWLPGSTTVEWVQYGGLLEPVELLTTAPAYLANVSIRAAPRGAGARIAVVVELANAAGAPFEGRVRFEASGGGAGTAARVGPRTTASVSLELALPVLRPWSPESPVLHDARVILLDAAGRIVDEVTERFGAREIETRGRRILLNGRPLSLRGVNRYDEHPGRGPVVDDATIRADLEAIRAMGANLVRTHYPQSPAHLRIADEIGLLFIEEVPLNWWRAPFRPPVPPELDDDRIVGVAERALEAMVRRDGNHPSLLAWSVANECQTADERGVRAMERLLKRAKSLDPTRPATYVANGRFSENRAFALADFVAVNLYHGMWDGPVAENIAGIESRVYEPTRRTLEDLTRLFPDKPIVLTEFGTIGIPGSGGDVRFSEDYQAAYLSAVWRAVRSVPEVSGGIVWSWADYRHRRGFTNDFPAFFGPFGLVTLDRRPKRAHAAMSALWRDGEAGP